MSEELYELSDCEVCVKGDDGVCIFCGLRNGVCRVCVEMRREGAGTPLEMQMSEAVPLSPVEACNVEVEQAERLYGQLRREAAALPDAMREAARAQDVEAMARLHDRTREIKGELFLAGAAVIRRRLNLREADSQQAGDELRALLKERAEVADLWRQSVEIVAGFEEEHRRLSLGVAMLDNRLTVNRQQIRDLKAELNALIEEQAQLGEVY